MFRSITLREIAAATGYSHNDLIEAFVNHLNVNNACGIESVEEYLAVHMTEHHNQCFLLYGSYWMSERMMMMFLSADDCNVVMKYLENENATENQK